MSSQLERATTVKLAWFGLCVLSAMLVLLPVSARSEEKALLPDRHGVLPELQKAVGKDWSVTALADGYLLTYRHPVGFYPAISENSKLDDYQRVEHGRMDYLRIKITFLYPPPIQEVDQYNAFWTKVHEGMPGFFECDNEEWRIEYEKSTLPKGQSLMSFSCNIPPDEVIPQGAKEDVYEHTLDIVAPFFHYIRQHEPWVQN